MFYDIGKKIKSYATIVFVLAVISSIILGIVIWVESDSGWGFFLFLIITAVSILLSFISVMFIYAFGDIADDIKSIRRYTDRLNNKLDSESGPISTGSPAPAAAPPARFNSSSSEWRCPVCDALNAAGAKFCSKCGTSRS